MKGAQGSLCHYLSFSQHLKSPTQKSKNGSRKKILKRKNKARKPASGRKIESKAGVI